MYAKCILSFSKVLNGTFRALYYIDHIPGLTISGGFHSKPLTGGRAAKRSVGSYMGTRLTAWLLAPAITLVCFFYLAMCCSY